MTAVTGAAAPARVAVVLAEARSLIVRRGLARTGFVERVPGRPFAEWPLSVDAAIRVAVGHGPYPGCLAPDCLRCARADAARLYLARRLHAGRIPETDRYLAAVVLDRWLTQSRTSEREVLAELAAAAEAAAGKEAAR